MSDFGLERVGERRWRVHGDLDLRVAGEALAAGLAGFDLAARTEVDLAAVGRTDSAGLAVLVEWVRHARHSGGELVLTGLPEQLAAIASLSGLSDVIDGAGHSG